MRILAYGFLLVAQSLPAYLAPTSQTTLDIASATWGGADVTDIFRNQYSAALANSPGQDPSFTFTASNDFFTQDPNLGIHKAAVVVYRAFFGDVGQFSDFQTVSVKETEVATLTVPNRADGFWQPPGPGIRKQYIIAATWYNKDVTQQVKQQYDQSSGAPSVLSPITVSIAALGGADPADGTPKQLSVTYGNYVNDHWIFRVAVDLNQDGSWTLPIPPAVYNPRDLRLNIISATWGGKDYTNWVREHYISGTIASSPTDTNNIEIFTASNGFFGPDPAPGIPKTLVVAFRFAYKVGETLGPLINQSDPPIYSPEWWNNGNPPAASSTTNYPILEDFTDIQNVSLDEGASLVLSLPDWPKSTTGTWGTEYQAIAPPDNIPPWVALAKYATTDITPQVNDILFHQIQAGNKGPLTIPNNPDVLGVADARPGKHAQLTVLVGWPTPNSRNAYEFRTISALNGVSDIIIPRTIPSPGKQYPEPFKGFTVRKVKFTNKAPTSSFPWVAQSTRSFTWNGAGERDRGHFHLFFHQSVTVDLISEGPKCKDGDVVSLGFYTELIGIHRGSLVTVAEVANTDLLEVVYGENFAYIVYIAGRVVQFVGQAGALLLEGVGEV